ncbi:MAG: sn-glycerol-1-phosphate dehydrogenase [Actinomycetota bacterium]|nr:sn-glycerol-1-phosphate dehydrogenase [Actinomycetota bacterium]
MTATRRLGAAAGDARHEEAASGPGRRTEGEAQCESCGLVHAVPVERVVLGPDAPEELGRFVDAKRWRRVLVVEDANTAEVLGDVVCADLAAAGHVVAVQRFSERSGLLADEDAVGSVRDAVASGRPDVLLAVGSGVLTDVTRYASFLARRPFVSVPTAPSMDGYASSVAAMQFDGVKVTLPSQAPLGVFADLSVVARAPKEMILSGFGDLAGKASARFDWELSARVAGEPFCEAIAERIASPLERCVEGAGSMLAGGADGIASLTRGLVESGMAMSMMGSSRPASGCEHHASHFLDLLAFRGLRPHAPHGLQVGYATRVALGIQRRSIEMLGEPLVQPAGSGGGDEERTWFGEHLLALGPVRDEKQVWFAEHADGWPPGAEQVLAARERLSGVCSRFSPVDRALSGAGVPDGPGYLDVDRAMLRATFRYANRLRSRFTVLDLLECQGRLDEVLDSLLA